MRLNSGNNIMRVDEIVIRSLTGQSADGGVVKYVPLPTKPGNRSTLGLMSRPRLFKLWTNLIRNDGEKLLNLLDYSMDS